VKLHNRPQSTDHFPYVVGAPDAAAGCVAAFWIKIRVCVHGGKRLLVHL